MKNNLRVLRTMRNLKQEEVAAAIGVSRQSIVAMEADKYDCSVLIAKRLARFFGVTVDQMFFLPDEPIVYPNVNPDELTKE